MWAISEVLTISMISNFFGLFYVSDYKSEIVLQVNVNVIEKKINTPSFEFSPATMAAASVIAQNRFPDKFLFGAGSSAYQIEGAYKSSNKGMSVWDYWTHDEQFEVKDKSNGDVACNSFFRIADDVRLLKNLGANAYRLSLSWTRILPNGVSNYVSLKGIQYYNELINTLILNGITPIVTLHHFDIPMKLQLLGGWTNPKMIEYFENYARIAFTYFGDRVKNWITINDPWELCNVQFGDAYKPVFNDSGIGNYLCGHNVLLAHAKVYKMYHGEFEWLQKGKVGISLSTRWFEPEDPTSPEDAEATEVSFQFSNYWFLHPLVGTFGGYPDIMRVEIDIKSAMQHFKTSRLPVFSDEEKELIKGSIDFLGISFFTTYVARFRRTELNKLYVDSILQKDSLETDMSAIWLPYEDAYGAFEIKNTAEHFGKLLRRLNDDYILPQIFITANGYPDFGEVYDIDRAVYHQQHLEQLFEAMKAGVDVRAYIAWSLMDSFEWKDGYSKRYGLYGVDFNDKNLPRKEKLSAEVIKKIYSSRTIPEMMINHVQ